MLNDKQKKRLLEIARKTIEEYAVTSKGLDFTEEDPGLLAPCGAFVTLYKHGELRGCIGAVIGSEPLYLTVRDMAIQSAMRDPRFTPVTKKELKDIKIEISVLSPLEKIKDISEFQLGLHGALIKKGCNAGLFLPQVATETGWTKEEFMSNLCAHKACLAPDAWKDPSTEIYIFTATVFSEKKKVDLIIFDFDGTLADSRTDIVNTVNMMLGSLGVPAKTPEEISGFIGTGLKQLIIDVLGGENVSALDKAFKTYKDFYRKHMFDNTVLYPQAKSMLEHFKDKKKVIISNKSVEFIELSLKKFKIEKFFIKILGGDDDNCRKPNPCPIIKIMKEFDVKPSETIIVGDTGLDIQTGRNAGILTCGATYGIGKKEEILALEPDFVIDSLSRLKDILR